MNEAEYTNVRWEREFMFSKCEASRHEYCRGWFDWTGGKCWCTCSCHQDAYEAWLEERSGAR